jgi:gliding motility-associated-like protein
MKLLFLILLVFPFAIGYSQAPNADFTASPLAVCLGASINFTNASTPGNSTITNYSWNFGNGQTSTEINPTYTYPAPGTYTITLAVQTANGQADAEVKVGYIVINPLPSASFNIQGIGCIVPFGVDYTNTSTTGPGITYNWNFGNGQTSTLLSPDTVIYNNTGNFTTTLLVTNQNSGCNATFSVPIAVSNYTAAFTVPLTGCAGTPIQFLNNSTVGTNAWNWNAGNTQTSNQINPVFIYDTPGTYTVTLATANTSAGCSSNTTQQITILPSPSPTFTATSTTTGCSPLPVSFSNTSTGSGTFVWNYGDGSTFSGQNSPTHAYQGNGSYSVTLVMTSANGCKDSVTLVNLINLSDPVVQFSTLTTDGCAPLAVQFTESSVAQNPSSDPITSWSWNFGDNTTFVGQNPPVHNYPSGSFDVTLTISTLSGCISTLTIPDYIVVGNINLINFSANPLQQCVKSYIQFTNLTAITTPHTPDEVTYTWDFGDGGSAVVASPSHMYVSDTGYFDVTLIVEFRGCIDSVTILNAVKIKAPISRFQPSTSLFCNPSSFPVNLTVNDISLIGKISDDVQMIWRWGDGTQITLEDPVLDDANLGTSSHTYSNYGAYVVKQVIFNYTTGCADSSQTTIYVSQTNAVLSLANDSICKSSNLILDGSGSTSSSTITSWVYNMGNGDFANGQNTAYSYTIPGTYAVSLIATNNVGCKDTVIINPLQVLELPIAQISSDLNIGCAPLLVNFSNSSATQGASLPLDYFTWSFPDDSSTQTTTNVNTSVNHIFQSQGNFNVSLVATDIFGCNSVPATTPVLVTKPNATFLIDSIICDLETYVTQNTSTGIAPLSYQWYLDGNIDSTTTNVNGFFDEIPSNSYTHVDHLLTLVATDGNGCKDTNTVTIIVSMPVAGISYTMTGGAVNSLGEYTCPPVFVDFEDQTESLGNVLFWEWNFGDNANLSTAESPGNIYVFPGVYSTSLHIIDEYGCNSDTTLFNYLTIFGPTGDPSFIQSAEFCGQFVEFDIDDVTDAASLVWNMGDGQSLDDSLNFVYNYTDFGTFIPNVTLTDSNNCVVIYPLDTIVILDNGLNAYYTANPNPANLGESITFIDGSTYNSSPIVNWLWQIGTDTTISNSTNSNVYQGIYSTGYQNTSLIVTDQDGCKSKYSIPIFINADFDMPNVFTPNGDNSNDQFVIFEDIFNSFDVVIQNRWGNTVWKKTNQTGVLIWDGTDNGNEKCHDGVYFYQIEGVLNDNITTFKKSGFVTLLDSK